jgi:hypothetical protein
MTVNHIENVPNMHSVYYYAPRGKLCCTQISLHFALLFVTHSIDDNLNFARVSTKLIIYWHRTLIKEVLGLIYSAPYYARKISAKHVVFLSVHRLLHCATFCHPLPLRQSLPVILPVLSFCHSTRHCCFIPLFVNRNSVVASFYLLIYSYLHSHSHCILRSH